MSESLMLLFLPVTRLLLSQGVQVVAGTVIVIGLEKTSRP